MRDKLNRRREVIQREMANLHTPLKARKSTVRSTHDAIAKASMRAKSASSTMSTTVGSSNLLSGSRPRGRNSERPLDLMDAATSNLNTRAYPVSVPFESGLNGIGPMARSNMHPAHLSYPSGCEGQSDLLPRRTSHLSSRPTSPTLNLAAPLRAHNSHDRVSRLHAERPSGYLLGPVTSPLVRLPTTHPFLSLQLSQPSHHYSDQSTRPPPTQVDASPRFQSGMRVHMHSSDSNSQGANCTLPPIQELLNPSVVESAGPVQPVVQPMRMANVLHPDGDNQTHRARPEQLARW